jgi:predicted Zn-ribbon and HTH transcriptional regulator
MDMKTREAGPVIGMVQLTGCRCRCGHEWLPRDDGRPSVCPKCKSPRWDKPKKWERKAK